MYIRIRRSWRNANANISISLGQRGPFEADVRYLTNKLYRIQIGENGKINLHDVEGRLLPWTSVESLREGREFVLARVNILVRPFLSIWVIVRCIVSPQGCIETWSNMRYSNNLSGTYPDFSLATGTFIAFVFWSYLHWAFAKRDFFTSGSDRSKGMSG